MTRLESIAAAIARSPSLRASAGRVARGLLGIIPVGEDSNNTIPFQFEKLARQQPAHPFLLYGNQRFTYAEANVLVNRHAEAYKAAGLRKRDVVAVVMENRPELFWHLLGLMKLGVVASLINSHAVGKPLAHAIRICSPKRIVVGSEVLGTFAEVRGELPEGVPVDVDVEPGATAAAGYPSWTDRLPPGASRDPIDTSLQTMGDLAAYLYTSGTTGTPKAALVKHHRFFRAARVFGAFALELTPADVLYVPLPLYHGTALMVGCGSAITFGSTIALARRFSASAFWEDCRRYGATRFVYVGELCRYLLAVAPKASDRDHAVRVICGNGLRGDIWERFQSRFGIERVAEFYAATEGNVVTMNVLGPPGSVGKMLPGQAIVRWDEEKQDFVRGGDGAPDPLRDRRSRRHAGPDRRRERVRRIPGSCGDRGQDRPRRVRVLRRVVQHGRSDACGPVAEPVFRRPPRRHVPVERRERLHLRGPGADRVVARRRGGQRLRRRGRRYRGPRGHGGAGAVSR